MELLMRVRYTLWGPFTILLMLATGVYLTYRSGFVQLFCVKRLARACFGAKQKTGGGISPLQALFTSLGGTLGVGNLAGVAAAITLGGAGAVFYMLLAAFLGMATKFAEIVLAVHFRVRQNGEPLGGPMVYLSRGAKQPMLAKLFCVFAIAASFGTGAMTQAGAIGEGITAIAPVPPLLIGIVTALLLAPLLIRGSHAIARASSVLVPLMTGLYLAGAIAALVCHRTQVLPALISIFTNALHPSAMGGGLMGVLTSHAVADGFAKGVFSNEAGMGSAPIAHGCTNSQCAYDEGVLGAVEVFIDTCVVCLMTALVILSSGALATGATGLTLTIHAFSGVFGAWSRVFIGITVCFLAFTTILGWSFYGLTCLRYLMGGSHGKELYLFLLLGSVVLSAWFPLDTLLLAADIMTALMAFPNLVGLWVLAPVVSQEVRRMHANS